MGRQETPNAISRHVARLWPRPEDLPTLIESAEAVERVLVHPGFQAIQQVLHRELASLDRKADRTVLEHGEYAHLHGRRSALTAFEDAAAAIIDGARVRQAEAEHAIAEETV